MDYLERAKLINKVIEDGHEIIDRMRLISKSSELEELKPIIDKYADFVDENFGEPSDLDDEKECSLTTSLYVALDWKRKSLYLMARVKQELYIVRCVPKVHPISKNFRYGKALAI